MQHGTIAKAGDVRGFYTRRRGDRSVWLLRYRAEGRQREFIFGHSSPNGILGSLASAIAVEAKLGRPCDFEQLLFDKAGAREPIPPRWAEPIARRLRSMIEAGRDLVTEQRQRRTEAEERAQEQARRTFEALAQRWLARHMAHKRSYAETKGILEQHVFPRLGDKPIDGIRRRDVHAIADALLDAGKVALAHRAVRIVRAMLGWLVQRGELEFNVASNIKLSQTPQARERVLSEPELRTVWTAAGTLSEPHATFVRVLMLSAQRLREVGGARWDELRDGVLVVPAERYKSAREHEAVLPRQALELIEALPRVSPFVFSGRGGRPIGDFSKLKERLDAATGPLPRWTFHDLRRSAASWLAEHGHAPHVIGAVLGHAVEGVLKVYARGQRRELKARALQSWADWLAGKPDAKVVPLRQLEHAS